MPANKIQAGKVTKMKGFFKLVGYFVISRKEFNALMVNKDFHYEDKQTIQIMELEREKEEIVEREWDKDYEKEAKEP